ncbi:MAG: hypothetical protein KJP21_02060, partial [Bacteroidia bacterium]|nr:hypothetical protein [Bacteroidia bacterium]
RTSVEANMFRVPGMTYTEAADGKVSNLYNLSLVNKTFEDMDFQIELKTKNATLIRADKDTILESNNEEKKVILIEMEQKHIHDNEVPMEMDLYIEGKLVKTFNTKFLAPVRE